MPSRHLTTRPSAAMRRLLLAAATLFPLSVMTARCDESIGVSRAELVDRWDLDGNGTIDESEATIARARMRRSRLELDAQSGIDPVSGRPRGLAAETAAPPEEPAAEPAPAPRRRSTDEPPPPGNRAPDVKRPTAPGRPAVPSSGGVGRDSGTQRPTASGPASPRGGAITGGVRAGAPAARPGYGAAVPFSELNAGRSRVDAGTAPEPAPRSARGRMSGGLLPRPQPPPARGVPPTRGAGNQPAVPSLPTIPAIPRVTAEDIGGS